jgi:hypothetical protein
MALYTSPPQERGEGEGDLPASKGVEHESLLSKPGTSELRGGMIFDKPIGIAGSIPTPLSKSGAVFRLKTL